jgi:hypothetical protein
MLGKSKLAFDGRSSLDVIGRMSRLELSFGNLFFTFEETRYGLAPDDELSDFDVSTFPTTSNDLRRL